MIFKLKNKLREDGGLHELVSGGAISFFMQTGGMLAGYVLMALIANYFGAKTLGIYSLSYTTLMFTIILSAMGMEVVILKIAGKQQSASSVLALKKIYSIVVPSSLLFACLLVATGYLKLFFDEMEYEKYLIIIGISLTFSVILTVNIEYIRANGNILASEFLRNIIRPLISVILIVVASLFYYDAYIPAYALLAANLLACIFSIYWIFWLSDAVKTDSSEADCNETSRTLIASGMPMQISMLAFYMISNMAIYFIQGYENSVSVGLLLVSIKLAGLINMPLMVLNKVCAQRISRLYWSNQHKELQGYLHQVTKLAFYAAVIAGIFLVIFSEYVLSIFGSDFIPAKNILFVLVFGQLVSCASGSVGIFMMMTGSEKAYRNIAIIIALLSFMLYCIIVPDFGLIGAAYVLAASQAALNITSVIYIKYQLGFTTVYFPFGERFFNKT